MAEYSIDTSSLIEGWHRLYPPDVFEGVWERLNELIDAGELIATEEVLYDVEKKEDSLYQWLRQREKLFKEVGDEIQVAVAKILARFPRLLDTRRGRSGSDPFVIALAMVEKCTTVVTQESQTNNPDKPNIPDACIAFGIKPITLLDLIRAKGWKFAVK